jgi:hypothetical protein
MSVPPLFRLSPQEETGFIREPLEVIHITAVGAPKRPLAVSVQDRFIRARRWAEAARLIPSALSYMWLHRLRCGPREWSIRVRVRAFSYCVAALTINVLISGLLISVYAAGREPGVAVVAP